MTVGPTDTVGAGAGPLVWRPGGASEIMHRPLPELGLRPRLILRGLMLHARHMIVEVRGLEHIAPARDPFVLVMNHNQRREAIYLPSVLIWQRGGKLLHFWSDWMFQLIPGVRTVLRLSGVITVTTKPARPRFLNVLKPLFEEKVPAFTRALRLVEGGASVGVFPEATINRNPDALLQGNPGAARLSLAAHVPVVPAGIRFPGLPAGQPIPEHAKMAMAIDPPMSPPAPAKPGRPAPEEVRAWHERIMQELARLSGKAWQPPPARR